MGQAKSSGMLSQAAGSTTAASPDFYSSAVDAGCSSGPCLWPSRNLRDRATPYALAELCENHKFTLAQALVDALADHAVDGLQVSTNDLATIVTRGTGPGLLLVLVLKNGAPEAARARFARFQWAERMLGLARRTAVAQHLHDSASRPGARVSVLSVKGGVLSLGPWLSPPSTPVRNSGGDCIRELAGAQEPAQEAQEPAVLAWSADSELRRSLPGQELRVLFAQTVQPDPRLPDGGTVTLWQWLTGSTELWCAEVARMPPKAALG
jgi:hypothetical protein